MPLKDAPWRPVTWYQDLDMTLADTGWEEGEAASPVIAIVKSDGQAAARAHDIFTFDPEEAAAMAAAPNLLEAVHALRAALSRAAAPGDEDARRAILLADATIAHAEARFDVATLEQRLSAVRATIPEGAVLAWTVAGPAEAKLEILRIPPHLRGCGTRIMRQICAALDASGASATLQADPTDEPGDPAAADLVRWYGRFGFRTVGEEDGVATMSRQPVRQPGAAAG